MYLGSKCSKRLAPRAKKKRCCKRFYCIPAGLLRLLIAERLAL